MSVAAIFDLDGTLADTGLDLLAALNVMRVERGLPSLDFPAVAADVGYGSRRMMTNHLIDEDENKDMDSLRQRFLLEYDKTGHASTRLFDGIPELLEQLEGKGIPWAIVTNKPTAQTAGLLPVIGLHDRAAAVICSDTLPRYKPHPDGLLHVCDTLGLKPEDCFFVGDNSIDAQAASACDMPFVGAGWGYWSPDRESGSRERVLDDPSEILNLIDR